MRDLLLAAVVFGLLPFVLKRPYWGVLLMAWLGYMNPHRLAYGFMLSFPVVMISALATMIGLVMTKEPKKIVWTRETIMLAIFIAWMGITTIMAEYPKAAAEQYEKVVKIHILTFITLMMLTSRERIHGFVWVVALSLGFYGLKGGVFTIVHGGAYRVNGPSTTFIAGNNELALALVMTIPLMRYLHLQEKNRLLKMGLMGGMLLTAIAAIGSQSRGALLALSLVGGAFWLKGRNKFGMAVLIMISAAIIVSLMPDSWYQRMDTIKTYDQDESALGRLNAWAVAWAVAKDRIFGGGFELWTPAMFARYAPNPDDVHDVHSIYFEAMGEQGFIGFAMFLSLLGMTWFKCQRVVRLTRKSPELSWAHDLAAMLQVSLVGYMTGGAFLGMAYFDYPYHLMVLAVMTHHLVVRTQASTGPSPGPGLGLHPARALSG